jgi:hypothetical protein
MQEPQVRRQRPSTGGAILALVTAAINLGCGGSGAINDRGPNGPGGGGPPLPIAGAPYVLYTDLISGPTTGGENDKGAYLSIFGLNFGSGGGGTTVKVFIKDAEVDNYRFVGHSRGRADIGQITVQVGALGKQAPGVALPIKVVVNGVASNTDRTFMINPGRILFVDNVKGNDATAVVGDIAHPFRHVQTSDLDQGAWGQVKPGDIMVMRGSTTPWTDVGFEEYFLKFRNKSGSMPTGAAGTGHIVLMGYPTEDVFIRGTLAKGVKNGCISAVNGQSFEGMGQGALITNLRMDCEGYDGPISQQVYGHNWRVVNNDLAASTAPTSGPDIPRMAGITGNGKNSVWLGNHIHDVQGSEGECHGIYIDGDGSYEIAYNHIEHIRSGNGFQVYVNGGNGSEVANDVTFHHNLVHDVSKHGINIADGSSNGFLIFDNVVYNTSVAGLRFNTMTLKGARIFHNTFYASNQDGKDIYGTLTNDWNLPTGSAKIQNNIFWPSSPTIPYASGAEGLDAVAGTTDHNLFFGGMGDPLGADAITADPLFVDVKAFDFHLGAGSPAIGAGVSVGTVVTTDFAFTPRAGASDLGAYSH